MVAYIRRCTKGVGEVVVMDNAEVGVRARAMAVEDAGKEKRRKVGNGELRLPSSPLVQITMDKEDPRDPCAAAGSLSSGHVPVSYCSNNGSTEKLKLIDLAEESVETETVAKHNLDTRASKPRRDLKAESGEPESIIIKPSSVIISRPSVPAEKMPPAAELEEFFAAVENDLHKRFKDKYNYDIVSDTSLEGRFEWVPLKP